MKRKLLKYLIANTNSVGPVTKTTTQIAAGVKAQPLQVYPILLAMVSEGDALDKGLVNPSGATEYEHNWCTPLNTTP